MSLISDPAFVAAALRLDHARGCKDLSTVRILGVPAVPPFSTHPLRSSTLDEGRGLRTSESRGEDAHHDHGPAKDIGSFDSLPLSAEVRMSRITDAAAFPILKLLENPDTAPLPKLPPFNQENTSLGPCDGLNPTTSTSVDKAPLTMYRPVATPAAKARLKARREGIAKLEAMAAAASAKNQQLPSTPPSSDLQKPLPAQSVRPSLGHVPVASKALAQSPDESEAAPASAPILHMPPPPEEPSARELLAARRRSGSSPVGQDRLKSTPFAQSQQRKGASLTQFSPGFAPVAFCSRPSVRSPVDALRRFSAYPPDVRGTPPLPDTEPSVIEPQLSRPTIPFHIPPSSLYRPETTIGSQHDPSTGLFKQIADGDEGIIPGRPLEADMPVSFSSMLSLQPVAGDTGPSPPRAEDVQIVVKRRRREQKHRRNWSQSTRPVALSADSDDLGAKIHPAVLRSRTQLNGQSELAKRLRMAQETPPNPFANLYAGVAARSASHAPSILVDIYFPFSHWSTASNPRNQVVFEVDGPNRMMRVKIRQDATMEKLIGFGLYCYVEEQFKPSLPLEGKDEQLTTVGWELRMVEDGDVDEDFPALDRSLTLQQFGANQGAEFAIIPAGPAVLANNKAAYASIQRRATRVINPDEAPPAQPGQGQGTSVPLLPAGPTATGTGALTDTPAPSEPVTNTPLGVSLTLGKGNNGLGTMTFLRVMVTPSDDVRYTTTVQVAAEMYLADVLDLICRKRQLPRPEEWALVVPDADIVVPLDRTVASLSGQRDLALVPRSSLGSQARAALSSFSSDPNAPIFDKAHEPLDELMTYQTWTVNRRTAMFVGRHEQRTLTLDGDWLHITPTDMRAFNARMASYPLSSVTSCDLSSKGKHFVKLFVARDSRTQKRYDFEALSAADAASIVAAVNRVLKALRPK